MSQFAALEDDFVLCAPGEYQPDMVNAIALHGGRVFVTWRAPTNGGFIGDQHIDLQILSPDGLLQMNQMVLAGADFEADYAPNAIELSDGRILVTYARSNDTSQTVIVAANGSTITHLPDLFPTGSGLSVALPDGRILFWTNVVTNMGVPITTSARILSADGTTMDPAFTLGHFTMGGPIQHVDSITVLDDGRLLLVDNRGTDPGRGIVAQILNQDFTVSVPDFVLGTDIAYTQLHIETKLNDGRVLIITKEPDGTGEYQPFGRIFNTDGSLAVSDFHINSTFQGGASGIRIAVLPNGHFFAVWVNTDIELPQPWRTTFEMTMRGRYFDSNGTALGDDFQVNTTMTHWNGNFRYSGGTPSVTVLPDGRVFVAWTTQDLAGQQDVHGRYFAETNTVDGSDNAELLSGTSGFDQMTGHAGNDILRGFSGLDTLDGGTGIDQLVGGGGNDVYIVDDSGDVVIEKLGGGIDLVKSTANTTLSSYVEDLVLQGTGLQSGFGNSVNNHIVGSASRNLEEGFAGNDRLEGGAGADTLKGDAGADTLIGGTGKDRLFGGSGSDLLYGTGGFDSLFGGSGADRLIVVEGQNYLSGGGGPDRFVFGHGFAVPFADARKDYSVIGDFSVTQGDRIDLSQIDANIQNGDQSFVFIGAQAFSGAGGEVRFADGLLIGDVDADGYADFIIALNSVTVLVEVDLIL